MESSLPVLSYELLAPHLPLSDQKRVSMINASYCIVWSAPTLAAMTRSCQEFMAGHARWLRITFLRDRLSVKTHKGELLVFLTTLRLSPVAQTVAEAMRTKVLRLHCDTRTDIPQMLNFLSHISSRGDLVVKASKAFKACGSIECRAVLELMRSDLCSHLEIETECSLELTCTAWSRAWFLSLKNLRVLSLGVMEKGIPIELRRLCEANPQLVHCGGYANDRPVCVQSGPLPHPLAWTDKLAEIPMPYPVVGLFQTSITDASICIQSVKKALVASLPLEQVFLDRFDERTLFGSLGHTMGLSLCLSDGAKSVLDCNHQAVHRWTPPTRAFHGTTYESLRLVVDACHVLNATVDGAPVNYASPSAVYALHPAFAKPLYASKRLCVQFLLEVDDGQPADMTQAATVECPFDTAKNIEWVYKREVPVLFAHLLVYYR